MGKILRSPESRGDYAAIWAYIAEHNIAAADRLIKRFDEKLVFLSDFPRAGPLRPELRKGVRSFPVGEYIVFYRPMEGSVELLRVLHGKRHLRRIFREMPK